ncbi:MAG: hypothetical protein A2Z19_07165 [Deltaproteobacteria bacterium RBG_16_54_18]|nr:MAG: hypothetical protein A2Z19_07165 [Deltaproteobacteria bacterium RBG_16_54_18]
MGRVRANERGLCLSMPGPETAFGMKGEICPYLNTDSYAMKPVMIYKVMMNIQRVRGEFS